MISVSVAYCRDRSAAVTEVRALHAIVPQNPRDQYSAPARAGPGGASVDCGRSFGGWSCRVTQPRGATYADARTVEREHEAVSVKDGAVESVTRTADRGVAFRVIHKGAWGFAATDRTDTSSLGELADEAFRRAEASASVQRRKVM